MNYTGPLPSTLTVELPLTPAYADDHVELTPSTVSATLDLSGGPRTFQSEPVQVGSYSGQQIRARLSFGYQFDKDSGKLTIRGNDDRTADQLRITSFVSGTQHAFLSQAPSLVFEAMPNDIGRNLNARNLWAAHANDRPVLSVALTATARRCNELIVKAALEAGIPAVLELGTPPLVTLENVEEWKRAFGEPVTDAPPADPIAEVLRVQFKVDSTYVGTVTWAGNTQFANVIGSTYDPKITGYPTWIGLWRDKCNGGAAASLCSSQNYFSSDSSKTCSGGLLGGHVILGTTAQSESPGATVYIYPICVGHNNTNNGYMKVINNPTGVQLSYW